ncbi:probable mediator of RNA polymerase II transcription subunit 26b [Juglans microcarpa x Juglans regia]|uniref:probable mediator of RNA polymerase II transcription subunit 26b n=1 Tax=Juglans microcarpa x Juglans regia TaxID=2249226 RepID=UPI001B7EA003|nr:probable mediator of RNA polymerase II transcription subunit 26b [Juglans microcarpa x Juglans regia]
MLVLKVITMKDNNLEYWKSYFQGVDSGIFEIIDHAIMVAATDHPKEFMLQRGQIAEKLYSCQWTQCCSHEHSVVAVPKKTNNENLNCECACGRAKSGLTGSAGDLEIVGGRQSKVDSSRDDHAEMKTSQVRKYTYSEAEALTDEIDEENEIIGEVRRIKEILDNSQEESETVLFESLRRLQLMVLSVEVLQTTMIGRAVNALRAHRSKQIGQLAQILISGWKIMVKDWLAAAAATVAEGSADPNPSTVVRKGLPSPPLDVGVLFATQTPIELSQFFDGIDDDGNPKNSMEYGKNQESGSKPQPGSKNYTKQKPLLPNKTMAPSNEKKYQLILRESVNNLTEPSKTESPASQHDHKPLDDVEIQAKLKATKRKIQDGYQQAEKARNQRKTQFMDFTELPKQEPGPRNCLLKRKNNFRHVSNGRH